MIVSGYLSRLFAFINTLVLNCSYVIHYRPDIDRIAPPHCGLTEWQCALLCLLFLWYSRLCIIIRSMTAVQILVFCPDKPDGLSVIFFRLLSCKVIPLGSKAQVSVYLTASNRHISIASSEVFARKSIVLLAYLICVPLELFPASCDDVNFLLSSLLASSVASEDRNRI